MFRTLLYIVRRTRKCLYTLSIKSWWIIGDLYLIFVWETIALQHLLLGFVLSTSWLTTTSRLYYESFCIWKRIVVVRSKSWKVRFPYGQQLVALLNLEQSGIHFSALKKMLYVSLIVKKVGGGTLCKIALKTESTW